jgi:hypothetical protein
MFTLAGLQLLGGDLLVRRPVRSHRLVRRSEIEAFAVFGCRISATTEAASPIVLVVLLAFIPVGRVALNLITLNRVTGGVLVTTFSDKGQMWHFEAVCKPEQKLL